jgi:hypothetical protein
MNWRPIYTPWIWQNSHSVTEIQNPLLLLSDSPNTVMENSNVAQLTAIFLHSYRVFRAAPQFRRLVASFPPRRPGFEPGCGNVEFVVDKAHWEGFLRVLRFPLPIFIAPTAPQSPSSIIWGWYNRPIVAAVPSGLSLTPLRIIKKILCASSVLSLPSVVQLLKNFPKFYGTWRFITVFTKTLQWSLSWVTLIQFIAPHPISLIKLRGLSPQAQTIPTERPPLVGEIGVNFSG